LFGEQNREKREGTPPTPSIKTEKRIGDLKRKEKRRRKKEEKQKTSWYMGIWFS